MPTDNHPPTAQAGYGVLVGWSHHGFNGRLDLCLQRVASMAAAERDAVEQQHFYMTENQALLLANYLLGVLDKRPPVRRRGWLARLFPR